MNSTLTELWKATTSRKRLAELSRSSLVSNAFLLMVNSAVNSAAGFFFWIIATRLFTPAEVGTGSALISAAMLMMT
ncbi:MAG: hypothetical protein HYX90_04925, partial [Chloroflexi bacterium]|nr:hypothetical protein [Chloroflexota bacterium]